MDGDSAQTTRPQRRKRIASDCQPRLFHVPDFGTAVFIEVTNKLTEMQIAIEKIIIRNRPVGRCDTVDVDGKKTSPIMLAKHNQRPGEGWNQCTTSTRLSRPNLDTTFKTIAMHNGASTIAIEK